MYVGTEKVPHDSEPDVYIVSSPHSALRISGLPAAHEQCVELLLAGQEIGNAWAQYKQSTVRHYRDGLEFGRVCRGWQTAFRAQGSRTGQGFERVLDHLSIPKTTAYRWIRRHEVKLRLRAERNEVTLPKHNANSTTAALAKAAKKKFSFHLFLTPTEQTQLKDDIELLGGRAKVTTLFLDCVSQKALEERASGNGNKTVRTDNPRVQLEFIA